MIRTFRYPLSPTVTQARVLEGWRISCQQLYNGGLEERRNGWRAFGKTRRFNYQSQTAGLTELRAAEPAWAEIPVEVSRSALRRLERAFQAFFRRLKTGEKPGFPRFRSRDRYGSFGIGRARIVGNRVIVPKLGAVKFKPYRPLGGQVRNVEIRKDARGRWFVCVYCDVGAAPRKVVVRTGKVVGIDVGLNTLAALSNGGAIENPRYFRDGEAVLARRQQTLARRKRGSRSRRRAKSLVARAHEHVRNQRLDYARKVAKQIVTDYDLIVHEDLKISRMVRGNLAKSIHDAGWGILLRCIASKAESAGKHVIAVDPRGTSQRCSMCGTTVTKDLSVRVHSCPSCGYIADRDLNAARNILALGLSAPEAA